MGGFGVTKPKNPIWISVANIAAFGDGNGLDARGGWSNGDGLSNGDGRGNGGGARGSSFGESWGNGWAVNPPEVYRG